jgi:hypothetical protein
VVSAMKKMRSSVEVVNDEIKLIASACRGKGWHIRPVWHSRSCLAGRCADALSRCDTQEFRTLAPAHPCLWSSIPTSKKASGSPRR